MTQQPPGGPGSSGAPTSPDSGPGLPEQGSGLAPALVKRLSLAAACIGLLVYLLAFVSDLPLSAGLVFFALVAGALLSACAVLPRVTGVLVPAAVVTALGFLFFLQAVAEGGTSALVIVTLVLALLQTLASVGALLLHVGVLKAPAPRPAATPAPPGYGYPQYGQQLYGTPPGYGQPQAFGGYGQPGYGPPPGYAPGYAGYPTPPAGPGWAGGQPEQWARGAGENTTAPTADPAKGEDVTQVVKKPE